MLKFDAAAFFTYLDAISWVEAMLPSDTADEDYEKRYSETLEEFKYMADLCKAIGLDDCAEESLRCIDYTKEHKDNPKGVHALSRVLVTHIESELEKRVFLWVRPNCTTLVDNNQAFGKAVANAFPSAKDDIKEAGNCLAADCGTAAVFHLMRAAEVALRTLGRDRRVTFPKGDISQKQWGEILNKLHGEIGDLVKRDAKNWPDDAVREAQIRFYQEALVMFNAFNDVWRRHVAHAHEGAMYDVSRAISVWNHTKRFMDQLATKLSETSLGAEYWTAA